MTFCPPAGAQEVAAGIEAIVTPGSAHGRLGTAGVAAFYEPRAYEPVWTSRKLLHQLADEIAELRGDGLSPEDYNLRLIEHALDAPERMTPQALAQQDVHITHCYLRALLHLRRGKVDPRTLDVHWNIEPGDADQRELLDVARSAVADGRIAVAFEAARPQHPAYATVRAALLHLQRIAAEGGWPVIAGGPDIKSGMQDDRVSALRQRLAAGGYLPATDAFDTGTKYDGSIVKAVRLFQEEQYLPVTGTVGRLTRAALNVPVGQRIEQLRVNLERARWVMHEIKGDFVLVDVAGYRLQYFVGAKAVWSTKVQVGRMSRQTPIIKSSITRVTFNPAWTVPPTILRNDIAPQVRRNAGYLRANHLRVFDSEGAEIPPSAVDWSDPAGITLRQDPGPWGALGRIAIRFSSPYMVYLHATPHVDLFAKAQRNFSSGCIRVEEPFELAGMLLGWDRAQMDAMLVTDETREVPLPRPLPIFILYWTISLRPEGRVAFKPDTYRMDPPALAALNERFAGAEL